MTPEQLEQFLGAVDERIAKAIETVATAQAEAIQKAFEGTEEEPGFLARLDAVEKAVGEGDQTAREVLSKLADEVRAINKSAVVQKSLEGDEITEGEEKDPLAAAVLKSIYTPGKVKLGFAN